ncbi:MAG: RNA methyltransferase [Gammaproteobacteria bacterium]|nr:RNA methyltransferase [Gammaproteobacteria bacterium]
MFDRIRIVLINTSHPGNIGAAARAMKTMGLNRLYLVSPQAFPHEKATEMASGAADVLDQAVVCETLDEAINDCHLIAGTSARSRRIPWPHQTPREMAELFKTNPSDTEIAILFGRERTGLLNEELERCHVHVEIPANPIYSSLNIAAAVQVMSYEIRMALQGGGAETNWDYRLSTSHELELFLSHLQTVLIKIEFLKTSAPRKLMTRMRRLFFRAHPDVMEINILRGMLTSIEHSLAQGSDPHGKL